MIRNKPGQTIRLFAFALRAITVNGAPVLMGSQVTGIANTITLRLSHNGGATFDSAVTHPTETEDGYYIHPLTQAETDAQTLDPYPESSIDGVQVIAVNYDRQLVVECAEPAPPLPPPTPEPVPVGQPVDIAAEMAKPQSTTVDGVSVTERSLREQIEADRYLAAKAAARSPAFGIGFRRVNPGSAVRE
jgi:hypothetical protein